MRLQVIARGWTKAPAIKTAWRPLRKVLNVYMAKVPRPLDSPNAPAETKSENERWERRVSM